MTRVALVVALVMAVGLVGLFGWALAKSGGQPRQVLVNSRFGEAPITQRPASPLTLGLLGGGSLSLGDLQGKVVMVDFWASWCPPCRQEAPVLARVYREYQGKGVEFVGIAIWDTPEEVQKYVSRYGITFPTGLDEKGTIAIDYGVTGIPEKYFLNAEGQVVRKFIGPVDEAQLRRVLEELLGQGR